jgi:hypothetical protein
MNTTKTVTAAAVETVAAAASVAEEAAVETVAVAAAATEAVAEAGGNPLPDHDFQLIDFQLNTEWSGLLGLAIFFFQKLVAIKFHKIFCPEQTWTYL